jgi:hypothetical protein
MLETFRRLRLGQDRAPLALKFVSPKSTLNMYSLERRRILYLHHYILQYIHFAALSLPLPLLRPVSVSPLFHGLTKRTGSHLC